MQSLNRFLWVSLILLNCSAGMVMAQDYYFPLNERLPPGYNAELIARIQQEDPWWLQPIRIELPSEGTVSVHSGGSEPVATMQSPAQVSVNTGHLYRLRVADIPELPGVELYPSIEILDRLHPPEGLKNSYPIPVVLSVADLKAASEGLMVTRVIYLEQPQLAASLDPLRRESPIVVPPGGNALEAADRLGRPMIIIRVGGRIPEGPQMTMGYWGTGGAVDLGETVPVNTGVARVGRPSNKSGMSLVGSPSR